MKTGKKKKPADEGRVQLLYALAGIIITKVQKPQKNKYSSTVQSRTNDDKKIFRNGELIKQVAQVARENNVIKKV